MDVVTLLNKKGLTMQQASDWVQARLDQPGAIYSICLEFGINSAMLAEIVQTFAPGVGATEVEAFFVNSGLDAQPLRNAAPVPMPQPVPSPSKDDSSSLFSQELGRLLSQDNFYWSLFSPDSLGGVGDGVRRSTELTQAYPTPAAVPLVSDEELAEVSPFASATVAQLVGTGTPDLLFG